MRFPGRTVLGGMAFALVIAVSAGQATAQDPVKVAPDVFKVLLENPNVRVLGVTIGPGVKVAAHTIAEHVGYVTEGGKLKITKADGKSEEMDLKTGEVKYGAGETHSAENTGSTAVRGVIVELREAAKGAVPPASEDPAKVCADVTKVLFDNDRVRVTETTLKAGGKMAMHSHPPHVVYAITAAKIKSTGADGKSEEKEVPAGGAAWGDAVKHSVENVGKADARVLNIELKPGAGAPPAKPAEKKP